MMKMACIPPRSRPDADSLALPPSPAQYINSSLVRREPLQHRAFAKSCMRLQKPLRYSGRVPWRPRCHAFPQRRAFASVAARVAVLYQAVAPPLIGGMRKPLKPGGYRDSGADIGFNLQQHSVASVVTPVKHPDPSDETHWCFPDTEDGILTALKAGATHLWANTILFAAHPLQSSPRIRESQDHVHVVGQPPCMVELYDDKRYLNDLLRKRTDCTLPKAWTVGRGQSTEQHLTAMQLPYPIVAKPVRGRGSSGVKLCSSPGELVAHGQMLLADSDVVMVEEYLAGEEATVTVMPPSVHHPDYWSLPVVTRFNHEEGIAPYNGVVAVTANSKAVSAGEAQRDPSYATAQRECESAARLLGVTAPIRIDLRRKAEAPGNALAMFDVNMKPNMTGPGRPGRDDQANLTAIAAAQLGWNYPRLLKEILSSAQSLRVLRQLT